MDLKDHDMEVGELETHLKQIISLRDETKRGNYELIREILGHIEVPYLKNSVAIGKPLFRCRKHRDGEDFFRNIDDISYRKDVHNIHEFGRANEPYQSMFYCSDLAQTAFFETSIVSREGRDVDEEIVTIGKWAVQKDINLVNFIVSEFKNGAHKENPVIQRFLKDFKASIKTMDFKEEWLKFMRFFSEEFMDNRLASKDYKTTAAFANSIYEFKGQDYHTDEISDVHGLIYPSARWSSEGLNLVIKPELIDQGALKLVDVMRVTFKRTSETEYEDTDGVKCKGINHSTGEICW